MSKIAIAARHPTRQLALAQRVHELTGLGLTRVLQRLASGPRGMFFSTELFMNDHVEQDRLVTQLLDAMDAYGVEPWIVEIAPGQAWSELDGEGLARHEIGAPVLRQMLADARGRFR